MTQSNVPAMTVTMIVCAVLSLIFMSLRFYCKKITNTRLGTDDYILIFSWLLYMAFIILSIHATKYGLGKHIADITDLTLLPQALYLMPIGQFFAVLAICVSKSSFIVTLLKLVIQPWQKLALYFMLVTINGSMLMIAIVQFYQCGVPPTPGCVDGDIVIALGVYASAYSAAMDIVLSAFPSLVIWNLQMQTKEKVGIIVAMSLGMIAGIIGCYKASTVPGIGRSADFTFGTAIVLIWLVAEFTATAVAASIPFYRPLLRKFQSRVTGQELESYGMSKQSGNHNKLGSQEDVKGNRNFETESSKGIISANKGSQVLRKTEFTVDYDASSTEERPAAKGQRSQREMF